jgi:hypothetical protein
MESKILKSVRGKTIDEAKLLFPSYDFQLVKYRGSSEVFYNNLAIVVTN